MGYRKQISPLLRLIIAMRALARHHDIAAYRIAAASQADSIPQSFAERMPGTVTGSIAKQARAVMKAMKYMNEDDRIIAAETLRNFADVLSAPHAGEIIEDTRTHQRSRRAPRVRRASQVRRALAGP